MLLPLVVDDVMGSELSETEEPRSVDCLRLTAYVDESPYGQTREVIAGKETLRSQITVRVEVGFQVGRSVQEEVDFAQGFPLTLLCSFPLLPRRCWRIHGPSRRLPHLNCCLIGLSPTVEGTVEALGRVVHLVLKPFFAEPPSVTQLGCASNHVTSSL